MDRVGKVSKMDRKMVGKVSKIHAKTVGKVTSGEILM